MENCVTEEKKPTIEVPAVKETVATPAAAAPVVLSQAPPVSPSDAKPVVDKASSVVESPLSEKK